MIEEDIKAVKEFLGEDVFNNMEQFVQSNVSKMPAHQQKLIADQLQEMYQDLMQLMSDPEQKNTPANRGKGSEEETEPPE